MSGFQHWALAQLAQVHESILTLQLKSVFKSNPFWKGTRTQMTCGGVFAPVKQSCIVPGQCRGHIFLIFTHTAIANISRARAIFVRHHFDWLLDATFLQ